jgi:gamma-glutamyl:cysteine ligase YbdK (ATP-grasp superfamily)
MLSDHAQELGCRAELEGVKDLLTRGTGAHRQLEMFRRNGDLDGLVAEIIERTRP